MTIIKINKPVIYQWWEPFYDRAADVVQPMFYRLVEADWARSLVWFLARTIRLCFRIMIRITWIMVKVLTYTLMAAVVIGCSVTYICLMFAMGQGKVATSISGAGKK